MLALPLCARGPLPTRHSDWLWAIRPTGIPVCSGRSAQPAFLLALGDPPNRVLEYCSAAWERLRHLFPTSLATFL
jgi:hypothetical protein